MERTRRRQLAEELAAKVARSRKDVVAVILFGSVARGDDGPDSDVELTAVVRRAGGAAQRFVLGGVLFNVYWRNAAGERRHMLEPDGDATRHGFLDGLPLYDTHAWFAHLKRDVANLPASFYVRSAENALHEMYEYVCKARNARRRGDEANVVYATGVVGYLARVLAALLNHRHYRSENTMTDEWRQFPDLPGDFGRLVGPLVGGSAPLQERYDSAIALWRLCRTWAARRRVRLRTVQNLREIRIPKTT
jgi:kanamycin nucleotidyltransferase